MKSFVIMHHATGESINFHLIKRMDNKTCKKIIFQSWKFKKKVHFRTNF